MASKVKRIITENITNSHGFEEAVPRPALALLRVTLDFLMSKKRPKPTPNKIQIPAAAYP